MSNRTETFELGNSRAQPYCIGKFGPLKKELFFAASHVPLTLVLFSHLTHSFEIASNKPANVLKPHDHLCIRYHACTAGGSTGGQGAGP